MTMTLLAGVSAGGKFFGHLRGNILQHDCNRRQQRENRRGRERKK